MQTEFKPFHFGAGDAALLTAAGYTHQFWPAHWEDIGGPESGPKLYGWPASHVWTLQLETSEHCIVVQDGVVVSEEVGPTGPEGWEEQF